MKIKKNGNLLPEETLKIIIAVIGIGFLIFLLTSLYFSLAGTQSAKYAEASLNNLILKEVQRVDGGGEYNPPGIFIPNPSGWSIFSFTGENKKPNFCSGENCICICKNIMIDLFNRQIKECDSNGVCAVISNIEGFSKIEIEKSGIWISIQKINENIKISRK